MGTTAKHNNEGAAAIERTADDASEVVEEVRSDWVLMIEPTALTDGLDFVKKKIPDVASKQLQT